MTYISIKEFAEKRGITYEAARRLVTKYKSKLNDHILIDGNRRLLDEDAVLTLDEYRKKSPVVVRMESDSNRADELSAEVELLRDQLLKSQASLVAAQRELLQLADARATHTLMLEEQKRNLQQIEELTADCDRLRSEADEARSDRDRAKADLNRIQTELQTTQKAKEEAESEAGSYHKSWFGFYRKR